MRTSSECQNDICCFGKASCGGSTFGADGFIRSLSCLGDDACDQVIASPVSGDLTCEGFFSCSDLLVDFVVDFDSSLVLLLR